MKYQKALLEIITPEGTEWRKICDYVAANVKVRKNGWMAVRGELQYLVNSGLVRRASDIHNEVYHSC
jgi:hypothetical protein